MRLGGWVTLWNGIPALMVGVEAGSRAASKQVAEAIAEDARALCPVDTGYLRSTIQTVQTGTKQWDVLVTADYAAYVEYGTYKMAAQPFLTPAVEKHKGDFGDIFKKMFNVSIFTHAGGRQQYRVGGWWGSNVS